MVLRWNRIQFTDGHVTVFLEFQKWPSLVTNIPKQQPNYRLSRIPASTVWSDRLTARSGVARQPNYSPWQVNLCAAVGAIRTDAYIQVDSQPCRQICEWRGEGRNYCLMRTYLWLLFITVEEEETRNPSSANKYWKETSIMLKIQTKYSI